jgi:hypothetical protein
MCTLSAHAQFTITGNVKYIDSVEVINGRVDIYADTPNNNLFATVTAYTDVNGDYVSQVPVSVPAGQRIYVSTANCDGGQMSNFFHYNGTSPNVVINMRVCTSAAPVPVNGYVYLGAPTKRPAKSNAIVYIYKSCPDSILAVDSVLTDTNGYYRMPNFPAITPGCSLVLKSRLLPIDVEYDKYLPAYRDSINVYSLRWSGASQINRLKAAGINITLPEAKNPFGGPAIISGKADSNGNALAGKIIFVTDMNDVPVAYQHTDGAGNFSFGNLPFGTYKLFGDVLEKDNPDLVVTVDANNVWVTDIVFVEDTTEFKGMRTTSLFDNTTSPAQVYVYPNPVKEQLYIRGTEQIEGRKQAVIMSVSGTVISRHDFADGQEVHISTATLPTGVYVLQLQTDIGKKMFKIVK